MTNAFAHYKKDGNLINQELVFSRLPCVGEIVFLDGATYEVVRVDHHPERNGDPRKDPFVGRPAQEDAELWLVAKPVPVSAF